MVINIGDIIKVENRSGVMELVVMEEIDLRKVGNHSGLGKANGVRIELYDNDMFSVYSNDWEKEIYLFTNSYKDRHCYKCGVKISERPVSDLRICEEQW